MYNNNMNHSQREASRQAGSEEKNRLRLKLKSQQFISIYHKERHSGIPARAEGQALS
jgi:hypothetical protein